MLYYRIFKHSCELFVALLCLSWSFYPDNFYDFLYYYNLICLLFILLLQLMEENKTYE